MSSPLISLLHPTARVKPSATFARGWYDACEQFFATCDHPESVEYIIAVHDSRWEKFWQIGEFEGWVTPGNWAVPMELAGSAFATLRNGQRCKVVRNTDRDCVVDQINTAAEHSHGKLISGVMDDLRAPEHWDTLLLEGVGYPWRNAEQCGSRALDVELIILCGSGATPERDRELMICGALTRKRYERYGFILDPDFESMYSDNWQRHVARRDEAAGLVRIIERLDIQFDHQHPSLTGGPADEVYGLQNRPEAYLAGSVTLHQKVTGCRVMVACLPGESFRSEIVGSRFQLIDDLKARTQFGIVAPHWCYTSNVYSTRIELAEGALRFPSVTKADDLILWIDDDNAVDFQHVAWLMEDLERDPSLGVAVGWCWCENSARQVGAEGDARWVMSAGRQDADTLACLRFAGSDFDAAIERGSFLISSEDIAPHNFWSGFPVVLMRRSVMEELGPLAFAPIVDGHAKNGFVSEDAAFFINAANRGIKSAVDIRCQVPHVKWRAIQPQYVPERERGQVEAMRAGVTVR